MKKTICILLVLTMILSICACGRTEKTGTPEVLAEEVTRSVPVPAVGIAQELPASIKDQLNLMFGDFSTMKMDDKADARYCVTDLDHNGRLELIVAATETADYKTTARLFEVNKTFTALNEIELGDYVPELITESADTYYDKTEKVWYYTFNDVELGSDANVTRKAYISYKDGKFTADWLVSEKTENKNGTPVVTLSDKDGKTLDADAFYAVIDDLFKDFEISSTNLDWFPLEETTSAIRFMTSYSIFSGLIAPGVVDVPEAADAKSSKPQVKDYLLITKNPTSEYRTEGETCIFVAKADNATNASWTFLCNGGAYNASQFTQMTGCPVRGADTGYLYVDYANTSLNSWSVYCTFTGMGGQSARTSTVGFSIAAKPVYNTTTGSYDYSGSDNYALAVYVPMVGKTLYVAPTMADYEGVPYDGCPCTVYFTGDVPTGNSGGSIYKVVVYGSSIVPAPSPEDYWECKVCYYVNNGGRICSNCGSDRYNDYWACSQCGTRNAEYDVYCSNCGLSRSGTGYIGNQGGSTGWACSQCGTQNGEYDVYCAGCGASRSGTSYIGTAG